MDARVYVEYRNNSDRPISAVKFRLRFVDAQGTDKGTFHAVDMTMVSPQGSHGLKAKRDFTLHPAVVAVKARVLQVKYGDGSDWSSAKMAELAQPGAPVQGGAYVGGGGGGSQTPAYQPATQAPAFQPAYQTPAFQPAPQAQAPAQPPVQSQPQAQASPPPWAGNPREYENPAAAVPPAAVPASGLSAGADVVDSFASPPPAAAATAPVESAPAATAPAASAPPAAAAAGVNTAPNTTPNTTPAAVPSTPPPAYQKYQGAQPTNVPFNPEADP